MIASGTDQRKSAGGISFTLHPFFLPEPDEAEYHDEDGDNQDRRIAPAPFQLRHIAEVHAVHCGDVLIQLAAVRSAINSIGKIVLADHMEHCIAEAVEHGDHEALDRFNDAIAKFLK